MKIALPLSIAIALLAGAAQAQMKLPELKKQPTPQAVLDEHFAALNACRTGIGSWRNIPTTRKSICPTA